MMPPMVARRAPPRRAVTYYRIHFLDSIRPDGAVCLECGRLRKTLGTHVRRMHEMTLDDYRERWGFNRQTVFIAATTKAKLRRLALERKFGGSASAARMARARAARRGKKRPMRLEARLKLSASKKALYASGWQPRRYRKVDDRLLRRLAKGGVETQRIARQAGLSVDQARRRLQALGLLPPRRPRRPVDRQRVLGLRREGLWPLEIARRLRIKRQHVLKILWQFRQQGVRLPTPSRPRPIKRRRMSDETFLAAYRRGGTVAQIAARLGASRDYVIYKTYHLRGLGVIPPVPLSRKRTNARAPTRKGAIARRHRPTR